MHQAGSENQDQRKPGSLQHHRAVRGMGLVSEQPTADLQGPAAESPADTTTKPMPADLRLSQADSSYSASCSQLQQPALDAEGLPDMLAAADQPSTIGNSYSSKDEPQRWRAGKWRTVKKITAITEELEATSQMAAGHVDDFHAAELYNPGLSGQQLESLGDYAVGGTQGTPEITKADRGMVGTSPDAAAQAAEKEETLLQSGLLLPHDSGAKMRSPRLLGSMPFAAGYPEFPPAVTPPAAAVAVDAPASWLQPVPPSASAAAAQAAAATADTTPVAASGQSRKLADAGKKWTPDDDRKAEVGRYPKRSAQEAAAAGPAGPGSSNEPASGSSGARSSSAAGLGLKLDAAAHAATTSATTSAAAAAAAAAVPGMGRSVKSMQYAFRNALANPATASKLQRDSDKLTGLGHIKCWKGKSNQEKRKELDNGPIVYTWRAYIAIGRRNIDAAKRVVKGESNKDRQCSALAGLDFIPYPLQKAEEFAFNSAYGDRLQQPDGLLLVQVKTAFEVEEFPARNPIRQKEVGSSSWVAADKLVLKSNRRVARDAALLAVARVALEHHRELVSCGEQMEIFSIEEETAGVHDSSASLLANVAKLEKQIEGRS